MKAILVGQRKDLDKQDKLTFDEEPKENSQNPVTSDGIYKKTSWISNPNLLDNWYFGNPVNQRGQDSYTGNPVYSIDRWLINGTLTLSNGIQVSGNLDQRLPLLNEVRGKQLTFSALDTSGNLKTVTGTFPAEFSGVAEVVSNGALTMGYDVRPGFNFVFVILTDGNWVAVKLEFGDTQTLAHKEGGTWVLNEIPDYGEQLSRCQRYQLVVPGGHDSWSAVGTGSVVNSSAFQIDISIPVTLAKRASASITGSWFLRGSGAVTLFTANNIKRINVDHYSVNTAVIYAETSTEILTAVNMQCVELIRNADTEAQIILDANL